MKAFILHPRLGYARKADLSPNPFSDREDEFATVVAEWDNGLVARVLLTECTLGFSA